MKSRAPRFILLGLIVSWGAALWLMDAGATAGISQYLQPTCAPVGPPPVGCGPSASGSPTGSPSGSPSPTQAPSEKFDSRISIKYARGKFSGAVSSSESKCEKSRTVVLKRVKGGRARTVGRTISTSSGRWKVSYSENGGKYYAKAKPRKVGGDTCKGARSKAIRP